MFSVPMTVACLYVPDFRLQVVLQQLGGEPEGGLALVDPEDGRRLIVAASKGARLDGVRRGMTAVAAVATAPELTVRELDRVALAEASAQLGEAVRSFTPTFETTGAGVIYASFVGLERRYAEQGEGGFIDDLREVAKGLGLPTRVGMASTRFAARAAAVMEGRVRGWRSAIVVPPGDEAAFLAPLPIELLPDAQKLIDACRKLGVTTLGAFAQLPVAGVARRFGRDGAALHRLARGEGRSTLIPCVEAKEYTVQVHAEYPIVQAEALRFLLRRPLEQLIGQLDGQGLATRCLSWRLQLEGVDPVELQTWSASPSGSLALWTDLVKVELDRMQCGGGVLSVVLEALDVGPRPAQQERLTGPRSAPAGALSLTLAHLAAELGPAGYGALEPSPSPWPEEREALGAYPPARLTAKRADHWVPDPARQGELPCALRRVTPAEVVDVELRAGRILSFRHRGGRVRARRVLGPWDVSVGWWQAGGGQARRCFQVEGREEVAHLYFEPRSRLWFLAGWLD